MKELTQQKVKGVNSLGLKFSALVFIVVLLSGLAISYFYTDYQHRQLLQQQHAALAQQTLQYQQQYQHRLQRFEMQAKRAHQVFLHQLAELPQRLPDQLSQLKRSNLHGWQSRDQWSGIYAANRLSGSQANAVLYASAKAWQQLMPFLQEDFANVFFMSAADFIRIAPADWVSYNSQSLAIMDNPLYQLVAAQPEQSLQWSPIYFDGITQHWLVSLLMPVYQQQQFIGVMGFSLRLEELQILPQSQPVEVLPYRQLLLDQFGQIISVQRRLPGIAQYTFYSAAPPAEQHLAALLQQLASATQATPQTKTDHYLFSHLRIPQLNWQILVYQEQRQLWQQRLDSRLKAFSFSLFLALLLTFLSYSLLHLIVLKRLRKLAIAVERGGHAKIPALFLDHIDDELGQVNRAFIAMSQEMGELVEGLNSRIAEKEQAELLARKLSKAVAFSSSGVAITNQQLQIEYLNPFLAQLLDQPAAKVMGQSLLTLFVADGPMFSEDVSMTLEQRQHWQGDVMINTEQYATSPKWVTLSIAPIRDDKGDLTHFVASLQDITFIKNSQKQMEQLAYFDPLTGLANRSFFRNQLRKAITMSKRGYFSFALLYFDLDEFKLINDTLGHDAGDELLIEVARRLKSRLRVDDLIARLGGDEFAVILSDIKDKMQAGQIAVDLQKTFLQPVRLGRQEVLISSSIGITVAPDDGVDEELLLKHADLAMYEAKAKGKNTYRFFSQQLNDAANQRLLIENQLREAIRDQQFMLYYQPKINLQDDSLIGYEALIRWLRPDNTLVLPGRFIHIAEATGLIVQIGQWIILEACRFLARQQSRGYLVTVAINLSARQFNDEQLADTLDKVIKRTGVDPHYLVLEITESMLMGDTDAAIKQLNQLKRLGVSLSIDDFGTGYSSLNYLKRFPVDELKIDRSFVKDIPDDQNDMDIVAAIIAMAQKMQLRVVAEGVESSAQAQFLKDNACYMVQGFYFSPPLAEQELSYLSYTIKTQG